jgi:hypothetical protein
LLAVRRMAAAEDTTKTITFLAGSGDDAGGEGEEECQQLDELLDEFYSFMYEKAVLVGPTGTSPSKAKSKSGAGSPTRGSPTHDAYRKSGFDGPPAANVPAAAPSIPTAALSREVMDALLPPKYVDVYP